MIFSDVNPDVVLSSSEELVLDRQSIEKSIESILLTPMYSRPFNRRFGSRVNHILFDPVDTATAMKLQDEIRTALNRWEQRVVLNRVDVLPDRENQQFYVNIEYMIPALGNLVLRYNFNLSKGT